MLSLSVIPGVIYSVFPAFVHLWLAGAIYFLMLELRPFLLFSFALGAFVSLFRFVCGFFDI